MAPARKDQSAEADDHAAELEAAAEAIRVARRARISAEAVFPVAIRTMVDLREKTLGLAEMMEEYAKQLRTAAGEDQQ